MIQDITSIIWKEWKEIVNRGGRFSSILFLLVPSLLLGVFYPLQMGRDWVSSIIPMLILAWIPALITAAFTADSFAGERERHTLSTLLAQRISDRSILLGKVLASISYALYVSLTISLMGIVTVNLADSSGELLFYRPANALFGAGLAISFAFFVSLGGILISMRAPTVRQAHQIIYLSVVMVGFIPIFITPLLSQSVLDNMSFFIYHVDRLLAGSVVVFGIITIDIILYFAASKKFRRSTLLVTK